MREIGVLAKKHPLTSLNHSQFRRAMDVCWENSENPSKTLISTWRIPRIETEP